MEDESWSVVRATVNTGVNVVVIKDFTASPSAIMLDLRRRYPHTVLSIIDCNKYYILAFGDKYEEVFLQTRLGEVHAQAI